MPIPAAAYFALEGGFFDLPYIFPILKTIPFLFLFYVLKVYFGGARNTSERDMHSKVVMITVLLPPPPLPTSLHFHPSIRPLCNTLLV